MKPFRNYVVIAAVILIMYAAFALWIDRRAVQQHELEFNQQQALQARLSAQSIEDHFAWILSEITIGATSIVPAYLDGAITPEAIQRMFDAFTTRTYPEEELVMGVYTAPDAEPLFFTQAIHNCGQPADLLSGWLQTYWETVQERGKYVVTPFYVTPDCQIYGLLVPIFHEEQFSGILGMALDIEPVMARYVAPVRSGQYGSAWVQDADSLVIYDREPETVGQLVTEIARPYPDLARLNRRFMAEDEGQGEYHFTVESDGDVERKLVAWSTVYLGDQRLTVALSAPDTEINERLAVSRRQAVLLGVLLGVTLVGAGGLFYSVRQRTLQKQIVTRTQELERLAAELEQRVEQRTALLEQERAQLKTILEAMEDGLFFRKDQQVLYANPALTRLLGYSNDEFLSRSLEIFREVTSAVDPSLLAARQSEVFDPIDQNKNMVRRHEASLKRKDGSYFDASVFTALVRDRRNEIIGTLEIIRDISHEKALQAQRDRFITNAAHELRRPLTNLKARLYLLGRQPEKLHEHVEIIQKSTDEMVDLVQDLVDMAQLASHKLYLNNRDLVLQHVLQSALDIQQGHAYRLRVQLESQLPDTPIHAHADYQRLTQTFNNLIAHAIQSTAPDGSVHVRLTDQKEHALIEIEDDGPIIEPEQLAFIFEPFFQPSEGTVQRTGMGLALARHIIEQHGGHIAVYSDADRNRFVVHLPLNADNGTEKG